MKIYLLVVVMFVTAFGLLYWDYNLHMHPVPDQYGTIHHPKYGDYPAIIPFEQGLTLLPGQTAIAENAIVETDICTNSKECTLLKERQ